MTYQPDFGGSWAKLAWAKTHRDALKRESDDFFGVEGNRIGLSAEYDSESGYHLFRVNTMPDQQIARWAMILGDCIHNLRGVLDHLAWQLALHHCNGNMPKKPKRVGFPITDTPELFRSSDALNEVSPAHRAIIECHQPYNGWHGRWIHPFIQLRELSNDDKHRVINPVLCSHRDVFIHPEPFERIVLNVQFGEAGMPLERGTVVAWATTEPADVQLDVEVAGEAVPLVTIPDSPGSWITLVPVLDEIAAFAANVIREFEPLP